MSNTKSKKSPDEAMTTITVRASTKIRLKQVILNSGKKYTQIDAIDDAVTELENKVQQENEKVK